MDFVLWNFELLNKLRNVYGAINCVVISDRVKCFMYSLLWLLFSYYKTGVFIKLKCMFT